MEAIESSKGRILAGISVTETEIQGRSSAEKECVGSPFLDHNASIDRGYWDSVVSPCDVETMGSSGTGGIMKRRRGRPKKDECGTGIESAVVVFPADRPSTIEPSAKRSRGRPKGSVGKSKHVDFGGWIIKGKVGKNFITYVDTVKAGEDVIEKIISFSQQDSQALSVLSAIGPVSSVVLSQHDPSGGTLRYEGRFEILSLSGSCTLAEMAGVRRKISLLTVSLAKPDGQVFGGAVAGSLVAAGPVQLVIGSFKQTKKDPFKKSNAAVSASPVPMLVAVNTRPESPADQRDGGPKPDDRCSPDVAAALPPSPLFHAMPASDDASQTQHPLSSHQIPIPNLL